MRAGFRPAHEFGEAMAVALLRLSLRKQEYGGRISASGAFSSFAAVPGTAADAFLDPWFELLDGLRARCGACLKTARPLVFGLALLAVLLQLRRGSIDWTDGTDAAPHAGGIVEVQGLAEGDGGPSLAWSDVVEQLVEFVIRHPWGMLLRPPARVITAELCEVIEHEPEI